MTEFVLSTNITIPVVNTQCDRLAIEFKEASCSPPPPLPVPGGGVALGDEAGR